MLRFILLLALMFPLYGASSPSLDQAINILKHNSTNTNILRSYNVFRDALAHSTYYVPHESVYDDKTKSGYLHPVIEYFAFLISHSQDPKIADVLQRCMTPGSSPFQFDNNCKPNEAEQFVYNVAFRAIGHSSNSGDNAPATAHTPPRQARWDAFMNIVRTPDFYNPQQWGPTPLSSSRPNDRYFFTNDFFLLSYSLGLAERLHNGTLSTTYLENEWEMSNDDMETRHNYVQWWFPSVAKGMDGLHSPRLTPTLLHNLQGTDCKNYLQEMNHRTWARMAQFWGQKVTSDRKLERESEEWENNWITYTHNYLRMTRILIWLKAFEMEDEYNATTAYLGSIANKKPGFKDSFERFCTKEPPSYEAEFKTYRSSAVK